MKTFKQYLKEYSGPTGFALWDTYDSSFYPEGGYHKNLNDAKKALKKAHADMEDQSLQVGYQDKDGFYSVDQRTGKKLKKLSK